jgi:diguanylate cyclase (GGDEF)-like protein
VHGQTLQVSASIGLAFCPRDGNTDAESLIEQADQAMYRAKRAGKNCYRFFDPALAYASSSRCAA